MVSDTHMERYEKYVTYHLFYVALFKHTVHNKITQLVIYSWVKYVIGLLKLSPCVLKKMPS